MIEPPATFEVLQDVNERVQSGDVLYDLADLEWYPAMPKQIGSYICHHASVARAVPVIAIIRHRRTRR